jgi:hypothetical protein
MINDELGNYNKRLGNFKSSQNIEPFQKSRKNRFFMDKQKD